MLNYLIWNNFFVINSHIIPLNRLKTINSVICSASAWIWRNTTVLWNFWVTKSSIIKQACEIIPGNTDSEKFYGYVIRGSAHIARSLVALIATVHVTALRSTIQNLAITDAGGRIEFTQRGTLKFVVWRTKFSRRIVLKIHHLTIRQLN